MSFVYYSLYPVTRQLWTGIGYLSFMAFMNGCLSFSPQLLFDSYLYAPWIVCEMLQQKLRLSVDKVVKCVTQVNRQPNIAPTMGQHGTGVHDTLYMPWCRHRWYLSWTSLLHVIFNIFRLIKHTVYCKQTSLKNKSEVYICSYKLAEFWISTFYWSESVVRWIYT